MVRITNPENISFVGISIVESLREKTFKK